LIFKSNIMLKVILCLLTISSFCSGQSFEQLMGYSQYYRRDIEAFKAFIKKEPSVNHSDSGVQQILYEFHNHNVGLEEHKTDDGKIGEIYVFQTIGNQAKAHYEWKKHFESLDNDSSFQFVKAVFDDGILKENNLSAEDLRDLLKSKIINSESSYGVRYKKSDAYFSLFVIKGKMVFTVDDKNF